MAGAVTRADRQRQQVGDQRPEGVDHQRPQGALGAAAGARQLGCAQAQGAGLLRPRHEAARRAGPSAEADERPRLVQPGVLHRRHGRARDDGVRRGRRLDGGHHHPDARAPRRRRASELGAGLQRQGPHLRGGEGRDRLHHGAVQVVSAARRPRRPGDGARQGDRQDQGSGDPPGDRQAPDHVQGRRMDGAPRAGRAGTGPAAGPRGLARQAGVEPRRPPGGAGPHLHHRRRCAA